MMKMIADKCNCCGKVVVKCAERDSSDMVKVNDSFLYLCDLLQGESGRPRLQLREYGNADNSQLYCLDCLVEVVSEWVEKMKKRGASAIPFNHVIPGNKVPSLPLYRDNIASERFSKPIR